MVFRMCFEFSDVSSLTGRGGGGGIDLEEGHLNKLIVAHQAKFKKRKACNYNLL